MGGLGCAPLEPGGPGLVAIVSGTGLKRPQLRDFPGGAVVRNPPANAGDTGLIPGPGRSHMLRSN